MRLPLIATLLLAPALVAQTPAAPPAPPPQPAYSTDSAAVMQVVHNVFTGMRTRDTALMRAQFHSAASIRSTRWRPETAGPRAMIDEEGVSDWLVSVSGAQPDVSLDERLGTPDVQVDGNLALVWAYYEFWLGDKFSYCGADQFTLGRTNDGWTIIFVADSKRRVGCTPMLPKGS